MTTLQLNPDTADGFESYSLADMRSMVFDELGFVPFDDSSNLWSLGMLRSMILTRLGLAVALLGNNDTFDNILADLYNAGGYASIGSTHPPGVDSLLGTIINNAHRTLFARIEFDQGGVAPPATIGTGQSTSIDATAVRLLAIAELKAHQGKQDAAGYAQQAERYLSDLTQRTPPFIVGIVNAAILEANDTVFRRWEMGQTTFSNPARGSMGTLFLQSAAASDRSKYGSTAFDNLVTNVDAQPVQMLALAMLKQKIGQPDAEAYFKQYEQYMTDRIKRLPPNATAIVNRALKDAQETLYRRYSVFRMERWYTWTTVANQRFYPLYGYDGASSQAPTAVVATIGTAVTSHNMTAKRWNHGVITLSDGRILILGGRDANGAILASAEIYDERTGVFTATGSMATRRYLPLLALLSDGRVLVAGGAIDSSGTVTAACEIYDPHTGQFASTGAMVTGRFRAAALSLSNGTVLVAGGAGSNGTAINNAEVFSPVTGIFTATGALNTARADAAYVVMNDGTAAIFGGIGSTFSTLGTVELYNQSTGTFSLAAGSLATPRVGPGAIVMLDGTVMVVGGSNGAGVNTAEIYSPATQTFGAAITMTAARYEPTVTQLQNEKILVAGGKTSGSSNTVLSSAETYDQATGTFTATAGSMTVGRFSIFPNASALPSGKVLFTGGVPTTATIPAAAVNTADLYDPTLNTFSLTGSLTQGTPFYKVTATTANGESAPSIEVFATGVPANTSVIVSWTPAVQQPFVTGYKVYRGKVSNGEGLIGTVPVGTNTFTDTGTIPQGVAPPTVNTTPGKKSIDPRHIAWVGLSLDGNVWNPLIAGIPPIAYSANISGIPTNYEIRDAIELWPPPRDSTWQLQVKGYFPPQIFEADTDTTTIDWQAILYQTVADVLPKFPGRYDKQTIADAQKRIREYIGELTAGTHVTRRYIPGSATQRNLIRPVFTGTYETYP